MVNPFRSLLVCAVLLGLSACQTTTKTSVFVDPTAEVGNTLVPVARALQMFDAVCGRSLPDFSSADRNLKQAGVTNKASTGTYFSPVEDISFKIAEGPGFGKSCSMVFATTETRKRVFAAYGAKFTSIRETPLGLMGGYRVDNRVTSALIAEPRRNDGRNYFNLRLLSESRNIRSL